MRKIKKQAEPQIVKMKGKRRNYTDCTCNNNFNSRFIY